MRNRHPLFLASIAAAVALGGCVGKIESGSGADPTGATPPGPNGSGSAGGPPGGPAVSSCGDEAAQVGPERIRRLTPTEYASSLRELLGDDTLTPQLDADREPIATLDAVRKWYVAAEGAAGPSALGSCDAMDAQCAATRYEAFAERAFRRPLRADERSWLTESWTALPAEAPISMRLEAMAELVLQAPQFLYVYAEGSPANGVSLLDGYARAERLSYFLWDGLPDQALLTAAEQGELNTPAGMRRQAERMLADERAKPVLRSFLSKWLELDGATILPSLEETPKDEDAFPVFDDSLRASMRREIEMFMDYVMFEQDGSLAALFSDTRAYVNGPLAELYGVSGPRGADEWAWVDLDATQRAGMLTRAGFLTVHAAQNVTSPIRRGVYMLTEVLCVDLPSPPANVDNTPVDVDEGNVTTVREATLARTGSPSCAACHGKINELGFAFEHYDAIGRFQLEEARTGAAIDATAQLAPVGAGLDGSVNGALELSARLATSTAVAECATRKWLEVAIGRSPTPLDACSVQKIAEKTAETRSIRELLLALVESDSFLHVSHGEQAQGEP